MYVFYEVGIVSAGFFNKRQPLPEESGVPALATASAGNGKAAAGVSNVGEDDYVGVPTSRRG
jgi:sec-independent protein translocase protein TatC